jgi:hypothetical protein
MITAEYCDARSRQAWHDHDYDDKYRAIDLLVALRLAAPEEEGED